uniref:Uncharacterized protein n=1 Tax=Glossina brevipalpis TaxID=37001 RepID=A0A1A9WST0_9MUSC
MELDIQSMPERKPINLPQSALKRASLNNSTTSSADNVVYPPSHQYHYIQYYQQPMNQYSNPQFATACQCSCSCGNQQQLQPPQHQLQSQPSLTQRLMPNHSHQGSVDSQRVAVIVHRQASGSASSSTELTNTNGDLPPKKAQSETSLLNHSYQALKMSESLNENLFDPIVKLKPTSSCDCDLECTCGAATKRKDAKQFAVSEAMLTADEITVSESDNNSSTVRRCERNQAKKLNALNDSSYNNTNHIDIYSDGDGDADSTTDACLKKKNGLPGETSDLRPPLPPRPPPRPLNNSTNSNDEMHGYPVMQFVQYSVPPPCSWMPSQNPLTHRPFVAPAVPPPHAANMVTNHRHGPGIKKYVIWCLICGGFSCILGVLFLGVYFLLHSYTITVGNFETVPTFVPATLLILTGLCIMSLARRRNRYSYLIKLSGACGLISALTCALVTVTTTVLHMSRLQALRECEYAQKTRTCTCYSDMIESQVDRVDKEGVRLVFDSLSDCGVVHGSLYSCLRAIFGLSVAGVLVAVFSCMLVYQLLSHERKKMYWEQLELRCRSLYTRQQMPPQNMASVGNATHGCRCCEQCHAHRQIPIQATAYPPWDEAGEPRFWSTQPPGNFYSPNPGGEDLTALTSTCRNHEISNNRSRGTGWSWNRWWQRNSPDPNLRFRQTPSSPDSQYGFTNTTTLPADAVVDEPTTVNNQQNTSQFNVLPGNLPYGVWGPPPPYSDPNSPARRGYYQYIQTSLPINTNMPNTSPLVQANANEPGHGNYVEQPATSTCCPQSRIVSTALGNSNGNFKSKAEYENTPSDSDCGSAARERERFSNTLPSRKVKKRLDPGNKSIGPNSQNSARVSVQQVFSNAINRNEEREYHEPQSGNEGQHLNGVQISKGGVENSGFQNSNENANSGQNVDEPRQESGSDPTESEVYFADVSSCCNMSLKNDHYYEDTRSSQRTLMPIMDQSSHHQHHQHQNSNCSSSNNEDYLAQRFGQRENSIRSRLPFPQIATQNEGFAENLKILASVNKENQNQNHLLLPKDMSRQSMCSVDSEGKTEFTDLSPSTPCSGKLTQLKDFVEENNTTNSTTQQIAVTPTNFVASYPPYSSESQSLEAHKRSTKNLTEAHYEVIDDNATLTTNLRNMPRTSSKQITNKKSVLRERLDNSDREWLSDGNNSDRQCL